MSGRLCSRLCIAFMQSAQELGYRSVTHRTLARLRAQQTDGRNPPDQGDFLELPSDGQWPVSRG